MNDNCWNVIGLMSGTSLDGVDIVYVEICRKNDVFDFQLLKTATIDYPKSIEQQLRDAFNASALEIKDFDIFYGKYLGEVVNNFIQKNEISKVDFVASHGHTIFHKPAEGYTLQIGDGQTLSNTTGLQVICDFRTQDVALGGQGAPLVPIGDELLFAEYNFCLNLGGFANISFQKNNQRIAFDICPANIVLNYYAQKLGYNYDDAGKMASSGTVNKKLFQELNSISFYKQAFPKSLGFEFVEETIFPIIEKYQLLEKDILRTFVEHIVYQISICVDNNVASKILVTGGGAFNTFLINELKKVTKCNVITPSKEIIDFKEALIFALLGVLRIENQVNCLSSVTGATKDHSSGKIFTMHT